MHCLAGVAMMDMDEKRVLLAHLESFDNLLLLKEGAMDGALKAKNWLAGKSARLAVKMGKNDWQERIEDWDEHSDWNTRGIEEKIERRIAAVSTYAEFEVQAYLKEDLAKLVRLDRGQSYEEIAAAYSKKLAEHYNIEGWQGLEPEQLEKKLYAFCVEEQLRLIRERVDKLSKEQLGRLHERLDKDLRVFGPFSQQALCEAAGLEELSADAVMAALENSSSVAMAKTLMAGNAYGMHLFLAIVVSSLAQVLEITFSFGVYTGSSGNLIYLLSSFLLLLVTMDGGGLPWWQTQARLNEYLIKAVFLAGKARIAIEESKELCD
ncbi:MAG TPA: hypothetical protein GX404_01980 [Syntrophomonadaceae bacterium]|nr:hypothetical protein [Syntrophomonadaceae bacterium]